MSDIIITPNRGSSNAPTIQFSGSANASASIRLEVLPEGQVAFLGKSGSLFSISDNMVGSLMAVSDISGLPILEVFSDDKVIMGKYNTNTLVVTGSRIAIGKSNPSVALDVSGSMTVTGSALITGTLGVTGTTTVSAITGTAASTLCSGGGTLTVGSNTAAGGGIIVNTLGTTGNMPYINFKAAGTQCAIFGLTGAALGTTATDALIFAETGKTINLWPNGGTTGMIINTSGNVGIGTSSPGEKLEISGNVLSKFSSTNGSGFLQYSGATHLFSITRQTNDVSISGYAGVGLAPNATTGPSSTYALYANSSGNIGIGTASPAYRLDVQTSAEYQISWTRTSNSKTWAFGSDSLGTYFANRTDSVLSMYITNAGNVGIGTTSPTGRLQIHNASGNTIALYKDTGAAALALGSTTGPTEYALIESINAGGVRFFTGNGTLTEKVRIDVNGNVGIGKSTPNSVLDINGNTTITGSLTMSGTGAYPIYANGSYGVLMMYSGTNYGTIVGTNSGMSVNSTQTTDLNLGTAGSANITIKYGGNVGIGKSTPNAVLDVNGNTIVTGSLSVVGAITATGNITAYFSDDRLKNNLGNIPDSLNKVLSLNGFYFEPNQTAIDLGYTKQKEVGVSAQQVQAILPEIIAAAPIDPMYMTVRYEKLIPLLIEAIKEQNSMIVDLQQRINVLEK